MESYDRKIKKLNVLEKLLKKDFVVVRKTLGDSEVVKEVNEELRQFLMAQIELILNSRASHPMVDSLNDFSFEEASILKELASKILKKAASTSQMVAMDTDVKPPVTLPPKVAKGPGPGPVWEALRSVGYDPEVFKSLPFEERKEVMKQIEKNFK